MKTKLSKIILILLISVVACIISLLIGSSGLSVNEVISGLLKNSGTSGTIIWQIRLPRICLAVLVGMGLAASGAVFQGLLRNPLAEPFTLGISGGAAFGAALGIITGFATKHVILLPVFAFLGALICILLVYIASSIRNFSTSTLILSGVILSFLFSSLVLLMISISDSEKVHSTMLWLSGYLSATNVFLLKFSGLFIFFGVVLLSFFGIELDILTLGEEKAVHLGVNTETIKKILFVIASMITAFCVSVSGIIAFVGLIIPHFARRIFGPNHTVLIPVSAILGAGFLVLCDTIARTIISPVELPVGVITGLFGGLFFLFFIMKSKNTVF